MDYQAAIPEIFLAAPAMALLLVGASGAANADATDRAAIRAVLVVTAVLLSVTASDSATAFGGLFIVDRFGVFFKVLVLAGSSLAILMSLATSSARGWPLRIPLLCCWRPLGMMLMISANDLISLYVGLELQCLALYVVAAFQRDDLRSTEAGMKYFVLGALASGMLLFGASLIYGFCRHVRLRRDRARR